MISWNGSDITKSRSQKGFWILGHDGFLSQSLLRGPENMHSKKSRIPSENTKPDLNSTSYALRASEPEDPFWANERKKDLKMRFRHSGLRTLPDNTICMSRESQEEKSRNVADKANDSYTLPKRGKRRKLADSGNSVNPPLDKHEESHNQTCHDQTGRNTDKEVTSLTGKAIQMTADFLFRSIEARRK